MGAYFSSAPSISGAKMEEILARLETTRIERELAIQEAIERRNRAYKLAEEKEAFLWLASGGGLTAVFSALSSFHHKNLLHMLPLMPIATYVGYKAHLCYGNKHELIAACTSDLIKYDADVISIAPISSDDVKRRVRELKQIRSDID